jgi:hypothetical protein
MSKWIDQYRNGDNDRDWDQWVYRWTKNVFGDGHRNLLRILMFFSYLYCTTPFTDTVRR